MNNIKPSLLIMIAGVVCSGLTSSASAPGAVLDNDAIEASFVNPPDSARPLTMWHWMNGSISKEGITKDLEAMKAAGVGGVMLFDVIGSQGGPVAFFSEECWN